MAQVFISYSSEHRSLTEDLAAYLDGHGLDVWWDRELVARSPFDSQIQEQLRTAGCILVIWTDGAVASDWVQIEACYGREEDKLVCCRDDDLASSSIPKEFRRIDAHKLDAERDLILRDVLAVREGRLLLEDKRDPLPPPDERTPAMLLQAKYGLIPFSGSTSTRDDLIDWALSRGNYAQANRRGAGRLIHGPGGLGKTRLLIEVAKALRAQKWSAGFLARPDAADDAAKIERRAKALGHFIRGANDKGLLLVMDYAEGREAEIRRLAAAIRARPADDTRPIRLVLLSRGADAWWTQLVEDDPAVDALFGGENPDVHALGGIATGDERLALFVSALEALVPVLREMEFTFQEDTETWRRQLEQRLALLKSNEGYDPGDGYDRPLAIAMEALLCVGSNPPGANEPGVHQLLDRILGLERDHWPKLVGSLAPTDSRNPLREMQRAVAQVTSVQGVETRRAAEDLFMLDGRDPSRRGNRTSVDVLTDNVAKIYGRAGAFVPLEPDLIGEHLVVSENVGDVELLEGCVAWILAEPDEAKRNKSANDLITVLQRATRKEHGPAATARACALIDHLIAGHAPALAKALINVTIETPGALSTSS